MRKLLLDIHLYLGLFCAGYFIIFGVSSIGYNRHWDPIAEKSTVERTITPPSNLDLSATALAVRDSLGLFGQVVGWTLKETEEGITFRVGRPGRSYTVSLNSATGRAHIDVSTYGLFDLISGLHHTGFVPGTLWGWTWGLYAWTAMLTFLVAVGLGIYFWWARVPERRVGFWLLGVGSGGSLILILYMIV